MSDELKIMIVEDTLSQSRILEVTLKALKYNVVAKAKNSEEALDYAASSTPDVVLMDIVLEGSDLDGIETARRIVEKFDIPVIFVTSQISNDIIEKAKLTGPFGYLVKPIQKNELKASIDIATYKHKAQKEIEELNFKLKNEIATRNKAEALNRQIFKVPSLYSLVLDQDETIEKHSSNWSNVLGKNSKDLIGKKIWELLCQKCLLKERRVSEGNGKIKFECSIKQQDGNLIILSFSGSKDLKTGKSYLTARDITEYKLKTDRYESFIKNSSEGFTVNGTDGTFIDFNNAFCSITGYSFKEIFSMNLKDIVRINENESPDLLFNSAMADGSVSKKMSIICKSGEYADVQVNANYSKELNLFYLFYHNITKEIKLEKQIRQSQKIEALGTMANGFAHEFNNLMQVILSSASMAEDDASSKKIKESLSKIKAATSSGKLLAEQILTFCKPDAGNFVHHDFNSLVNESVNIAKAAITEDIEILLKMDSDCGEIFANANQVNQMFFNLILNSSKALTNNKERKIIEITVARETESVAVVSKDNDNRKGFVKLCIKDNGCGIPEKDLNRIYDPFYTTHEPGKGIGLGLFIVYSIVESHNASISISSKLNRGTSVEIIFPVVFGEGVSDDQRNVPPETKKKKKANILILDDDNDVASVLGEILALSHNQVRVYNSPDKLLNKFEAISKDFDILVTDYKMPGIDGITLSREIYKINPDFPIILLTGYGNIIKNTDFEATRIKEVISKPTESAKLNEAINRNIK